MIKGLNISYKVYKIKKSNGKYRVITAPNDDLKQYQRLLVDYFQKFPIHDSAHGFIKGRSIATNALPHINKNFILNIDLKDFFPSINKSMIKKLFEKLNIEKDFADIVTYKNSLPQGSPCSPILSNLICYDLDIILEKLAKDYNYDYTRYADDLTFSGKEYDKEFLKKVYSEVFKYGLKINFKKTKLQWQSQRQVVTGFVVNKKLNLTRNTRKRIRAMKHQWENLTEYDKQYLAGMNSLESIIKHSNA